MSYSPWGGGRVRTNRSRSIHAYGGFRSTWQSIDRRLIVRPTALLLLAQTSSAQAAPRPTDAENGPPPHHAPTDSAEASANREPNSQSPQNRLRISGQVLEAGRRHPVLDVQVVVTPRAPGEGRRRRRDKRAEQQSPPEEPAWIIGEYVDENGHFELRDVPDGPVRVQIVSESFRPFTEDTVLVAGEALELEIYLERRELDPYRTTVVVAPPKTSIVRRRLTVEELEMAPGSLGDPLRALQNLPGVARTPFGAGGLMIRGTAPHQSALFINGHQLPRLYHFFAISTVFQSSLLKSIDFVPGNFTARYGDAIGGIVEANTKGADPEGGVHGVAKLSLIDLAGQVQTKVGDGSLVVAARRSHIDSLVGLGMTIARSPMSVPMPRYWDYQALFEYPLKLGRVWTAALGSDDRMINVPLGEEDGFQTDLVNGFHRADFGIELGTGRLKWMLSPSYLFEVDRFGIANDPDFDQSMRRHNLAVRQELSYRINADHKLVLGSYGRLSFWQSERPAAFEPERGTEPAIGERAKSTGSRSMLAGYLLGDFKFGPVHLLPEVRATTYGAPFARIAVDPRLRVAFQLSPSTRLALGGGLYSQAPAFSVHEGKYRHRFAKQGRLPLERSVHAGISLTQDFPGKFSLELTGYYAHMWNLVPVSAVNIMVPLFVAHSELAQANQEGQRFGFEVLLRKQLTKVWFGWLSYSLSRSQRRSPDQRDWTLFDFDQTHNLTAVLGVKLPRHFRISARFRLTSGNPYTPCEVTVFDTGWDYPYCLPGRPNSERLPAYHQLDLRLEKTWVKKRTKTMLYVDLFNVYHQKNIEFALPGSAPDDEFYIYGMPFLPSLGVEVKF